MFSELLLSAHPICCGRVLEKKTIDNAMKLAYSQYQSYLCQTTRIENSQKLNNDRSGYKNY
jgi:hypothetical protein